MKTILSQNRIALFLALLFLSATSTFAATITVTNLNDSGAGSLRQAILDAMAGDTIDFDVAGTITLTTGEMIINKDLTVQGPGADMLTISGNNSSRIFNIDDGDSDNYIVVSISGLKLENGFRFDDGGALLNNEELSIDSCVFDSNTAVFEGAAINNEGTIVNINNSIFSGNLIAVRGAAIKNSGTIENITNSIFSENLAVPDEGLSSLAGAIDNSGTIENIANSTFSSNQATLGGAIANAGDINVIINSTFSSNRAPGFEAAGGAIYNDFGGNILDITNCTFNLNSIEGFDSRGGAIFNREVINISFTTIANNEASGSGDPSGGGIFEDAGSINIRNSIVAYNTASTGSNCNTDIATGADETNNYSNDATCGFGTILMVAGELDSLADNGGPTETLALLSGPALNGASAMCDPLNTMGVATGVALPSDQRYFPRPFGAACDSGAFETQPTGFLGVSKTTVVLGTEFEFLGSGFPESCGLMDTFFLETFESEMCILPLGTYTVEEIVPAGFVLDITCTETPSSETPTSVTIDIGEGDSNTCFFTNTPQFTLNLTIAGNGSGTVDITPPGETCEPDCIQTNTFGTDIGLTPNPEAFSLFEGITGDKGCGEKITITEDLNCTATFTLMQFLLSVSTSGTGDGTVTAPAGPGGAGLQAVKRGEFDGINCGEGNTNCEELYDATTMVTLTATPDADSDFTGWTGACAPAGTSITAMVNMTSALSCDAEFTLKTFDVSVIINGTGGGTVEYDNTGAVCPGICSQTFDIHTEVTLADMPDVVSMPAVWSPNCPGGVIADLTEDTVCTATFNFLPLELGNIFPAVQGNPNFMDASNASTGGFVAFIWGFSLGNFPVNGLPCGDIVLGINPFQLLGFAVAGANQIANFTFFIVPGTYTNPTYTQAVDLNTCRVSDVVTNIISNK